MASKNRGKSILSDSDIIKMCEKDKYFIEVILIYDSLLKSRKNRLKMKLRILISKELEYFKRRGTTWFFGVMPENRNEINMVILEFEDYQRGVEVA